MRAGSRPRSRLVGLLFDAWADLDRVVDGLTPEVAVEALDGGSSFAWSVAHLANHVDTWINVRFQGAAPHSYISKREFRFGGTGAADDWGAVRDGERAVHESAREYLLGMDDEELDRDIPYVGSLRYFSDTSITPRYALFRAIAHHYFHIGEIASKLDRLGHSVGDYPGKLDASR
jgi:uncharacterized damage-inducible protein DinB